MKRSWIFLVLLFLFPAQVFAFSASGFQDDETVVSAEMALASINTDEAYQGYTLFTPLKGGTGENGESEVYLVDMNGEVVHTWHYGEAGENFAWLEEDGTLWMRAGTGARPGDVAAMPRIAQLNEDSEVLYELSYEYSHHDFALLPNGHLMLIAWEEWAVSDDGAQLWTDKFVEIDPESAEELWSWSSQDHMELEVTGMSGRQMEALHTNALEYIPENPFTGKGALLVSYRISNTIMMIEYPSGDILWEYSEGLEGQHDPTYLDNGNILVYNNGKQLTGSSVLEINPLTNEVVWSYADGKDFFSSMISGAQRLPNGNTLITEGAEGRIFEVTSEGEIVWEMNPFSSSIFRAYRYSEDDIPWLNEGPIEDSQEEPEEDLAEEIYFESKWSILLLSGVGILLVGGLAFRVLTKTR